MFKHRLFLIANHTNMHVGSGEANFGIVDNLIQRDVITNYPTIHSSSLKGALREYCRYRAESKHKKEEEIKNFIKRIFGDEDNSGYIRFSDAWLLAIPFRSSHHPYHLCVSTDTVKHFLEIADIFDIELENREDLEKIAEFKKEGIFTEKEGITIEDFETKTIDDKEVNLDALKLYIKNEHIAIADEKSFKELLENLPIIARNRLENGESKNLWYEEIVPRKSIFFTIFSEPTYLNEEDKSSIEKSFQKFFEYIEDETPIQIGANSSIGYGVCTMEEVKKDDK